MAGHSRDDQTVVVGIDGDVLVPIEGYEGAYSITESGHVYSHYYGRFIKTFPDRRGYLKVSLYKDEAQTTHLVHRLVAEAWWGESSLTVNHIDGDKTNNHFKNLEYLSNRDNIKHAHSLGLVKTCPVIAESINIGYYYPRLSLAKVDGHDPSTVCKVLSGARKTHGGYTWTRL